jgi:hypothetical protein
MWFACFAESKGDRAEKPNDTETSSQTQQKNNNKTRDKRNKKNTTASDQAPLSQVGVYLLECFQFIG